MIKNRYKKLLLLLALLTGVSSYAMHLDFGESLLELSGLDTVGAFPADAQAVVYQPAMSQQQPELLVPHAKPKKQRKRKQLGQRSELEGEKRARIQEHERVESKVEGPEVLGGEFIDQLSAVQKSAQSKKKAYVCTVLGCGETIIDKSGFSIHMRAHAGEKPHQCEQCPKAFARKSDKTRHMKTHTGVKDHACGFCPKKFARPDQLEVHERLHIGDNPFSCEQCGCSYAQKIALKKHIESQHAD